MKAEKKDPTKCNDWDDAEGCLGEVDERYTMDFRDVPNGGYIYWCSKCGPVAQKMLGAIIKLSPEKKAELRARIDKEQN